MGSYALNIVILMIFTAVPPIVLKKFIKKYVVWRFILGPSALVGMVLGYYMLFKWELFS